MGVYSVLFNKLRSIIEGSNCDLAIFHRIKSHCFVEGTPCIFDNCNDLHKHILYHFVFLLYFR